MTDLNQAFKLRQVASLLLPPSPCLFVLLSDFVSFLVWIHLNHTITQTIKQSIMTEHTETRIRQGEITWRIYK